MNYKFSESLLFLAVLIGNVVWYAIKWILAKEKYPVHLFWGHFGDIRNFVELIQKENYEPRKRTYRLILATWFVAIAVFFIVIIFEFF